MSKDTTRRLVAVMLAVLAICSFAGAPAIAAAGSGNSLGDDVSSVGSGDSTGDSDSSDDSADDGSNDSTDDSTDSTDDSTDEGNDTEEDLTEVVDETATGTTETVEGTTETVDETANVAAYRTFEIAGSVTTTTDVDGLGISYGGDEAGSSTEGSTVSEERFSPRELRAASSDRRTDARSNREAVAAVKIGRASCRERV